MKQTLCTVIGACGSIAAYFFGGWDTALICLCVFMLIDLVTGIVVALIFHKSPKNKNGKIESKQFLKGFVKKIAILLLVGVSHLLDLVLGTNFVRNAVIIGFIVNEVISITENTALMGIPIPKAIINALELLNESEDKHYENQNLP